MIFVGTAGWNVPKDVSEQFPSTGSHLQRYANRFPIVEINSSFKKPHREATYRRWAATVSESFRFSVKLPKTITHTSRLIDCSGLFDEFMGQVSGLGEKLGCLLVQLPPSLEFDRKVAARFFRGVRKRIGISMACEPRHPSWFGPDALDVLIANDVCRAAADPARVFEAKQPAGRSDIVYFRLHGSPRVYYSAYDKNFLDALAVQLRQYDSEGQQVWCIFDNTTLGAAARNGLELMSRAK
jgi:uncharacterized protein YecE (DUF72 family)